MAKDVSQNFESSVGTPTWGHEFWRGVRAGLPISFGYFPSSIAFGVVALASGFSGWQPVMMSMFVFSGAGQFLGVNLWQSGASLGAVILANLIINLRYIVMSASLSRRIQLDSLQAAVIGFGVTDETFVLNSLAQRGALTSGYVLGVNTVAYLGWVIGTVVGTVFAGILPGRVISGMGIVLYAMFIALLVPSIARSWKIGAIAAISGALCWVFGKVFAFGWAMVLATTIAAALGAWLWDEGVDDPEH
ncbi:MAG: AzlC family ABC transporter permease [Firmicutes bacterium]|nr:AzlC family ABC transporter permease [Bacillota bacterium]